MTNHGDDCYFFYYSTCTKGDGCPFRHCEAAMGNEIVCSLWQEGRCFRKVCKFRHMEITKNRKEISCYWEKQAAGCQKPHCAFFHEKSRYIDGMFVPADKSMSKNVEQPHEEPAPAPPAPLPTAANPQIRGVIKTEAQDPVPSPTHPPVVINPADDDEDEDDQVSEEGEDGRVGPSPRKLPKSGDSLNFGVSTLEEIRLRKALKASMKRAHYPTQGPDGEEEIIESFFRPALYEAGDGTPVVQMRSRGSVADRLGRKLPDSDVMCGDGVQLKRSLAERLGRAADDAESLMPPQKSLKTLKERLGLSDDCVSQPDETKTESKKAPEEIRIKTLEEIRQEKLKLKGGGAPETSNGKGLKRAAGAKDQNARQVKTFSEILREKKRRQEEEEQQQQQEEEPEKPPGRSPGEPDSAGATNPGGLRVKTLEEIRREKAARIQAQQESKKSSDGEENGAKAPRLLRVRKPAPQRNAAAEKSDATPLKTPAAAPEAASVANGNAVKVKTFEEIMLEKRLRKQEMEDQAKPAAEAEPCKKQTTQVTLKRKAAAAAKPPSPGSSPTVTPDPTPSTQKVSLRKQTPLRSKAAVNSAPAKQSSPPPPPAKQARASPQAAEAAEAPPPDAAPNNNQKKSPERSANTKVRPKLNVKPSVVKPAAQVKPGPKRRSGGRSAVAAVKPLNSSSTEEAQQEAQQEAPCRDGQEFPSPSAEAQLSSAVPRSPATMLDSGSGSSPQREDLQTVPVFKQSQSQETKPTASVSAARDACTVPQSPVLKTPTQPRTRRSSVTASRTPSAAAAAAAASTSAVDDLEKLISEFAEDDLEDDDVDAEIGDDDLLQELSEMIDS